MKKYNWFERHKQRLSNHFLKPIIHESREFLLIRPPYPTTWKRNTTRERKRERELKKFPLNRVRGPSISRCHDAVLRFKNARPLCARCARLSIESNVVLFSLFNSGFTLSWWNCRQPRARTATPVSLRGVTLAPAWLLTSFLPFFFFSFFRISPGIQFSEEKLPNTSENSLEQHATDRFALQREFS